MKPKMLLHELHPAVVHMPLALLPLAAVTDVVATVKGDAGWAAAGRKLWKAGTASALFAGVAGLAASQEVRLGTPRVRDMTFIHGVGNLLVTTAAIGITAWRWRRAPNALTAALGVAGCMLAGSTAALGGKMVYEYGVGVNPMPAGAPQGTLRGPPLLSREAPLALLRDAVAGLGWLLRRGKSALQRKPEIAAGAFGVGRDAAASFATPDDPGFAQIAESRKPSPVTDV